MGKKRNLAAEGIKPEHIFVTGNTVIDALPDDRRSETTVSKTPC